VGIFVACRVKNCQHLNRLRHADEKRGYRPDADDSQLDTACRLGGHFVHDYAHPWRPRRVMPEDDRVHRGRLMSDPTIDHAKLICAADRVEYLGIEQLRRSTRRRALAKLRGHGMNR
jgi:hypothetical protein